MLSLLLRVRLSLWWYLEKRVWLLLFGRASASDFVSIEQIKPIWSVPNGAKIPLSLLKSIVWSCERVGFLCIEQIIQFDRSERRQKPTIAVKKRYSAPKIIIIGHNITLVIYYCTRRKDNYTALLCGFNLCSPKEYQMDKQASLLIEPAVSLINFACAIGGTLCTPCPQLMQ